MTTTDYRERIELKISGHITFQRFTVVRCHLYVLGTLAHDNNNNNYKKLDIVAAFFFIFAVHQITRKTKKNNEFFFF